MATGVKVSQLPEHTGSLTGVTIGVVAEGTSKKLDASKLVQVGSDGLIPSELLPEGSGGTGGDGNYTESVYGV